MYETKEYRTYKIDDEGERTLLANFTAWIDKETRYVDGINTESILTIRGKGPPADMQSQPVEYPPVDVPAEKFAGLTWVLPNWGTRAIIQPGGSIKEDLRTAIQLHSTPAQETVYRHIGWAKIDGQPNYLHASGAIGPNGNNRSVRVQLPHELRHYDLTTIFTALPAVEASLNLTQLAPPQLGWPLLAATLTPLYGPTDFGVHLTGRTGTFKSELCALFQSHYGSKMDARHLPGSWSSTPNALEAQAFYAANALFTIDDFVPHGSSYQQKTYQSNADKLFRAQGNQAGRARLTDTSHLQTTMFPRGLILSTGEDTPEGHSVRARMLILELSPGDIEPAKLSIAQRNRQYYPATVAHLIQFLAQHPPDLRQRMDYLRSQYLTIGHTRTPSMLARLVATIEHFLVWAQSINAISAQAKKHMLAQATEAILESGKMQHHYLEAQDPCEVFCQAIRNALAAGSGHLRTLSGGIPLDPTAVGWTEERATGEIPTYKARGPCMGWANWDDDQLYLDITVGFAVIKKVSGNELSLTKQTLMKRLKESGLLTRVDENRQRNTVRITAEQHARQVLCLSLSQTLDTQEKPSDERPSEIPD